jgi:hypothetical protein
MPKNLGSGSISCNPENERQHMVTHPDDNPVRDKGLKRHTHFPTFSAVKSGVERSRLAANCSLRCERVVGSLLLMIGK